MTKYVGLIGYPLGHSISPAMQQAGFDNLGLDIRYELWETERGDVRAVVEGLRQPSKLGANVTVPYKEMVLEFLNEVDRDALDIGAVNTIVNRGGRLKGYNTDAGGFLTALRGEAGFDARGKHAVLLGAGGVARAVSFALVRAGIGSLTLTDIIMDRAQGLACDIKRNLADKQVLDLEMEAINACDARLGEALSGCNLLVNCTPIGMKHSDSEGKSPVEYDRIPQGALVYDVVYNPVETELLSDARRIGAQTLGGLCMLVYQGALAFDLWTEKAAPVDIMMSAAKKALL